MKTTLYPAKDRGHVSLGWLTPFHSFSFGQYHDPKKVHFGALRVVNDDSIAGGGGFGTHPHDNMEIVTIPWKANWPIRTVPEMKVSSVKEMYRL